MFLRNWQPDITHLEGNCLMIDSRWRDLRVKRGVLGLVDLGYGHCSLQLPEAAGEVPAERKPIKQDYELLDASD